MRLGSAPHCSGKWLGVLGQEWVLREVQGLEE